MQEIFNFNKFFKKKIYLITGASSYLAKPLINFLQKKGSIIICIGRVKKIKIFFFINAICRMKKKLIKQQV